MFFLRQPICMLYSTCSNQTLISFNWQSVFVTYFQV